MSLYGKTRDKYYESAQWKYLAAISKKRTKGYCGLCPNPAVLVHHLSRENWKHEDIRDLIPLCWKCHDRLHDDEELNAIIRRDNLKYDDGDIELLTPKGKINGHPFLPYYDVFLSRNESRKLWSFEYDTEEQREESRIRIWEDIRLISPRLIDRNITVRKATENYIWWLRFNLKWIRYQEYLQTATWPIKQFNPNEET